ncbi:MAG: cysteine methyltransferase [Denitrovibrio sp.]|nr:MAG: cysteine methyltransferase [Denitrovibrio sp.]
MLIEALDDLDLSWTTPFQLKLYKTLALIPCGTLISYGALAELIGRPGAARAVGAAMTANRFSIIIPAHRVVRAGRKISGRSCMKEDPRVTLLHSEGVFDFEQN